MALTTPREFSIPFANGATAPTTLHVVPIADQAAIDAKAASYTTGFPAHVMTAVASGGEAPYGQDVNGILKDVTSHQVWVQGGQGYAYSDTFAADIGGYPIGTILRRADGTGSWLCTTAANASNPDTGGSGWHPINNQGITAITGLTNANRTLTALEAAKDIITLAGTLTANIEIRVSTFKKSWIVVNLTTGAFTVTFKTSAGSGVVIPQTGASQPAQVYGDGTNIYFALSSPWSTITSTPTTVQGYSITNAVRNDQSNTITTAAGNNGQIANNAATGSGNFTYWQALNNASRSTYFGITTSTFSGAYVTNGPAGESAFMGTNGNVPLAVFTNQVARLNIAGDGSSANFLVTNLQYNGNNVIHAGNIGSQSVLYATSAGRAYPYRSDGTPISIIWSGQSGQPSWLLGSNDGSSFYVYNPANFTVNSATYATQAVTQAVGTSNTTIATTQFACPGFLHGDLGYDGRPSGLLDQWGYVYLGNPAAGSFLYVDITFPIPFPNACYSIELTVEDSTLYNNVQLTFTNKTRFGFRCGYAEWSPGSQNVYIRYGAKGK